MPTQTYKEITANLKKKIFHPVYFLSGEESYFIDKISEIIESDVLREDERDFNLHVLYGRDVSASKILDYARQLPMLANFQVVIVREAQDISDIESLKSYVEHPNSSTILTLCYKNKKPDKRKLFFKTIQEHAVYFESKKLSDKQVPIWIEEYLKVRNYSITPKSVMLIAENIGGDISKITNEIDKMLINIPQNTQINENHIEQNIGISKDYNIFELLNALSAKQIVKANTIVNYFAANSKSHSIFMILPLLFDFFVKVLMYHQADKKVNSANLASILGVAPFLVQQYQLAAKHYSPEKAKRIIGYCREYDLKGKGVNNVSASEGELLKELIFKILH